MKKLILLTIAAITISISVAHADISPEKRHEIEKMIQLTGMDKQMDQMKVQMISRLKALPQMKDVPASFWPKFQDKVDVHELLERLVPLYDKYFTLEDLKTVNASYESPTGKKFSSTRPQFMQEAIKIGQDWG